jgi:hypothetical protein
VQFGVDGWSMAMIPRLRRVVAPHASPVRWARLLRWVHRTSSAAFQAPLRPALAPLRGALAASALPLVVPRPALAALSPGLAAQTAALVVWGPALAILSHGLAAPQGDRVTSSTALVGPVALGDPRPALEAGRARRGDARTPLRGAPVRHADASQFGGQRPLEGDAGKNRRAPSIGRQTSNEAAPQTDRAC